MVKYRPKEVFGSVGSLTDHLNQKKIFGPSCIHRDRPYRSRTCPPDIKKAKAFSHPKPLPSFPAQYLIQQGLVLFSCNQFFDISPRRTGVEIKGTRSSYLTIYVTTNHQLEQVLAGLRTIVLSVTIPLEGRHSAKVCHA